MLQQQEQAMDQQQQEHIPSKAEQALPRMHIPDALFTTASDAEALERIRYEPLVQRVVNAGGGDDVYSEPVVAILHDVLSQHECQTLMRSIDTELQGSTRAEGVGNRECDRAVRHAPEIAHHVSLRVWPILEKILKHFRVKDVGRDSNGRVQYTQEFSGDGAIEPFVANQRRTPITLSPCDAERVLFSDERSLDWEGSWELHSMKAVASCLRYRPGDHFDIHTDDNQVGPTSSLRKPVVSLFTGLLYLNADFCGGSTNLMSHAEGHPNLLEINPANAAAVGAPGCLLIFFQKGMLHEGHTLESGNKYVIRSDIFYEQTEMHISKDAQRGLELLQEARDLFAVNPSDPWCLKKYQKACDLNPAVQRMSLDG